MAAMRPPYPPSERARFARAIRIRIARLQDERLAKALAVESLDGQLDELLEAIIEDSATLSRLRSAARRLEFAPLDTGGRAAA
jgi:hypothetical protein